MAEIAVLVIAKLAEYLVDPVVRQGQYLFCASKIAKTLETEKQRLASTQDGVQKRVQEARNRTEKINEAVEKWLGEVNNHMDEVQKLEQQMKEGNNCFHGRCPNWKRYHLCRQMARMIVATKHLNEGSEFNPFSVLAPLPDIEYFSSRKFLYFQSTKLASDQLLAALQDDGIHMIGLFGMGGSGKTTLVQELGKKAKDLKLFDRVLFATVSQHPNIKMVQGEIADLLTLELREETESGRARRLSMRLSNGERILMILDDVWAKINLKDIGIPFEDYHVGCKILLTTRRQHVCNMMGCERKIHLNLLNDQESWTLFQIHASVIDSSLNSVAHEIVKECKGLPIAIQAIGISLKGKSHEEWKEALRRLKDSKPINEEGDMNAFACLRLSYDYLKSKEEKAIFLMCSMYPEDEDISVEDLFRIAIGSSLCKEVDSLENVRSKVTVCINNLIDSCLLMSSEKKKDHLRMHDTIRDVALWIASEENRTIMINLEKDMNMLVEDESIKDCYAFTSWCSNAIQISQQLNAPRLEILLVKTNSFELSEAALESMKELKVVGIVWEYHHQFHRSLPLPHSMNFLSSLQTLCLQGWELDDDLSWVLGLQRLEILDLKHSSFKELPKGFEELKKLKLLDLIGCQIKEQTYKVIKRCTQLEELYVSKVQLNMTTPKFNKCIPKYGTFPKLRRYQLKIGNFSYDDRYEYDQLMDLNLKTLTLGKLNISSSSSFIKDLLQRAETICLDILDGGCKNIVPDVIQVVGGMNELVCLGLYSCSNLECFIDATSHHIDLLQAKTLFPKLIKLRLKLLPNLKEIWRGPPLLCFCKKLQELYISNCPMLTSLFPKCFVGAMMLLQKLSIEYCSELKNIIEVDGIVEGNEIIPVSDNSYLVFSHLKILTIRSCGKLEYVFSNSCVQGLVQLEEVCIEGASKVKYVFGHHEDEHQEVKIQLPILKSLTLNGLKELLSVFPKKYYSSCPSLKKLNWMDCLKFIASCVHIMDNQLYNRASAPSSFLNLEQLYVGDCGVEDILFPLEGVVPTNTDPRNILISTLETLKLKKLPELMFVWSGPTHTLNLQNLREFTLEEIISDTEVEEQNQNLLNGQPPQMCFPNMKWLKVRSCNKLKWLFSVAIAWDDLPQMCFPNLRTLEVEECDKLKWLFSMAVAWNDLPEVEYLYVKGAAELEQVFKGETKPKWRNNSKKIILPKLKELRLEGVPSLKEFCQGLSLSNEFLPQNVETMKIPALLPPVLNVNTLEIRECGRLTLESLLLLLGSKIEEFTLERPPELWWKRIISRSLISNLLYLRTLKLIGCNKLKSVFCEVTHGRISLPMLEELSLIKCEELEEIVREDQEFHTCFPKLTYLWVWDCNKLKCVFSASSVTRLAPHLESIHISKCAKLEEVFKHKSEASSDYHKQIVLPNLTYMTLKKLPSLVDVCKGFKLYTMNLLKIDMSECPKFSSIMGASGSLSIYPKKEEIEPHANNDSQLLDHVSYLFPTKLHLTKLELQKLCELSSICSALTSSQILSFQYLQCLTVDQCEKLKCIFSTFVHGSLRELEYLRIWECEEVEEIIGEFEEAQHLSNPNLHSSFPKLTTLEVKGCHKLKYLFKTATVGLILPKLRYIDVSEASQLEELFSHKSEGAIVDVLEIVLPKLRKLKLERLPSLTHFCKELKLNATNLEDEDLKINECPKLDLVLTEIQENSLQPNTQQRFQMLEESKEGTSSERTR